MIDPTNIDIGRGVIYRADSKLIGERERGVITSFNNHAVFVRYTNGGTSQATSREDLTWEFERTVHNVVDRAAGTIGPSYAHLTPEEIAAASPSVTEQERKRDGH